jgi:hypothetical protein
MKSYTPYCRVADPDPVGSGLFWKYPDPESFDRIRIRLWIRIPNTVAKSLEFNFFELTFITGTLSVR